MRLSGKYMPKRIAVLAMCIIMLFSVSLDAAAYSNSYLDSLNAGVAVILDADLTADTEELIRLVEAAVPTSKEVEPESMLVMANVKASLNVRAEADEDSEKVGKLYKDCGGVILERNDGWTKIQSGDLIGWASDEYLLFGEEAEALANDVGNLVAKVEADALRVRKEPSEEAGVYGSLVQNDKVIAQEVQNGWVVVEFENNIGYVSADYVTVEFQIDSGETMEAIKQREKEEAEAKAKLRQNRGAVDADVSEVELLAALIQCEAGGESYDGQLAVGAVVMNRVRSAAYPNSIYGVIFASGQFTPAGNGKVAKVLEKGAKASCMQAAEEAIAGNTNVGDMTHFRRAGSRDGLVIGNHVFW